MATLTRPEESGGGSGAHQFAGIVIWAKQTPFSPSGLHAAVKTELLEPDDDEEEEEDDDDGEDDDDDDEEEPEELE